MKHKKRGAWLILLVLGAGLVSCAPDPTIAPSATASDRTATPTVSEAPTPAPTLTPTPTPTPTPTSTPTPTPVSYPLLVEPVFPADEPIIADYCVTDPVYGADPTGRNDSTSAIQKAINACAAAGGGTVWMPAGTYLVQRSISIKSFVTLCGDWADPEEYPGRYGTVILAKPSGSGKFNLFNVFGSAGAVGLTVYYPEQSLGALKEYGFTFYVSGGMLQTIRRCTVINGWKGIGASVTSSAHEMMTVDTFRATCLRCAAEAYDQSDVGTWKDVRVSPRYWAEATALGPVPDASELSAYMKTNTVGLILGDLEWAQFNGISVSDCQTGVRIVKGKRIEFAGALYQLTIRRCQIGIDVESIDTRWGAVIAHSSVSADIAVRNVTSGVVKLADVAVDGQVSGKVVVSDMDPLPDIDVHASAATVKRALYVFNGTTAGELQTLLNQAKKNGGGIVYMPAGTYRFSAGVTVPGGVMLRGGSAVPVRGAGTGGGTVILATLPTNRSVFTLESGSVLSGVYIVYPNNTPGSQVKSAYAVTGRGGDVSVINCCISGAYNGVDLRGCDRHLVQKLVCFCYGNAICAGGRDGRIEGCLQNATVMSRGSAEVVLVNEADLFTAVFDPISRQITEYIRLSGAENELIFNCFIYGGHRMLVAENSSFTAVNIGADNLGSGYMINVAGESSGLIANMMRYNGYSCRCASGTLIAYNRLTAYDQNEPTYRCIGGAVPDRLVLTDGSDAGGWYGVTTDRGTFLTGGSSLRSVGAVPIIAQRSFDPVDVSAYRYLHLVIRADDLAGLGQYGQIEICNRTCDHNEYSWSVQQYVTTEGWNDLYLPFSAAIVTGDEPDLSDIGYLRIYSLDYTAVFYIDLIEFVKEM